MSPSLYDLLDVDPTASDAEIRAAWKAAIADLDPTDRRFRAYNQAAEVLLDPEQRAAYDAELAAEQDEPEPSPEQVEHDPAPVDVDAEPAPDAPKRQGREVPAVPGWLLIGLAVVTVAVIAAAAYFWSQPSDSAIEDATREAQSAAERAIVPVLSYDVTTLDDDQAAGQAYLTDGLPQEVRRALRVHPGERATRPGRRCPRRSSPPGSCAPARTGSRCCCSSTGRPPTSSRPSQWSTRTRCG